LSTMELHGFEALVRWRHPTRGEVAPDKFISIAEETGLIVPIGKWVLDEACEQLTRWHERFPQRDDLTVSVNVSKRQLADCALVDIVRAALERTNLPSDRLRLEITESVMMENTLAINLALPQLAGLGVQLHMDDFGTGYSSLSCLHQFPLNVLKIDRAFLKTLDAGLQFAAMLHAVVTLAHNLKMRVTAEGIETADQLAQVLALECDYGQGYLFARPLSANAAGSFIANPTGLRQAG
jgi:EAL domain-containing protein (putative c-di-GMP-specific phosphodiesterase class I)